MVSRQSSGYVLFSNHPGIGGEHFIFFSPIFNFADAAISCGIIALLLFYGKYLNKGIHPEEKAQEKDA